MYLLVSVILLERHHWPDGDVHGVANDVGLAMFFVNYRFFCAYAIGIQFLSSGVTRSSM